MDEAPKLKTDRRRRRPALSCVSCRRSKIRCDRNLPCGACVRSKHRTCVYEPQGAALPRHSDISSTTAGPHQPPDTASGADPGVAISPVANGLGHPAGEGLNEDYSTLSLNGSTPIGSSSSQAHEPSFDVKSLLDRINELERRLEESTENRPARTNITRNSAAPTNPDLVASYPSYLAGDLYTMNKSVMTKTRYLGQSHWMNQIGNFKSVLEMFDKQCRDKKSEPILMVNKCKSLARTIKAQRAPEPNFKFGANMPSREISDKLVEGYLRTTESVFRVLHIPTFRKEYEKFWLSPESADTSFVIQLQLVLAIGSAVYDDQFTMRKLAMQWVFEAQCWLISPVPKSRLTISGLQVMLLLCLAQETACSGHDMIWILLGQIVRTAMYMGLHRDPKKLPKTNPLRSEMRRRLWNTTLEIALHASMTAGGPPLIRPEEYDTCAPANCDDDELTEEDTPITPNPPSKFTDMSIPLALHASFSERLAIAWSLNGIGTQNTYDDTIRLHGQLMTAYKSLSQNLHQFDLAGRQPTGFQRRFLDLLVRRYFLALHLPYFGLSMSEPAYAFSRKTVVETGTKLYCTVYPSAALSPRPLRPSADELAQNSVEVDDLARLTTCSAGFYRSILSQVSMAIGLDLQNQLQEEDGLGPPTPRTDLLNILRDSASWVYRRLLAGENNVKGYLFTTVLLVKVEGLMSGMKHPECTDIIIETGTEALRESFELLKRQADPQLNEANDMDDTQLNFDTIMTMDQDWEYESTNPLFNFTSIDFMLDAPTGSNMMPDNFSQW